MSDLTADTPARDSMPDEVFDLIAGNERTHWWYRSRRELVIDEIERADPSRRSAAMDVGCGTGAMVKALGALGFARVVGADLSSHALGHASSQSGRGRFLVADAAGLPVETASLSCVTSMDVVEHLVDDREGVLEYARALEPGGTLILTVPAYQWMWGEMDEIVGHKRRYTRRRICAVVEAAGLEVERATYFHSWVVPFAFLLRKTPLRHLMRETTDSEVEVSAATPLVNRVLYRLTRLERFLSRWLFVPFGLSVLVRARAVS